jgi:hypothetical protein
MKILAVGNSFSGNATRFLREIVNSSGGSRLVFGHASIGGCPLEKHYKLAMRHEKEPMDSGGIPYMHKNKKMGLKEMLVAERWQYVTIQQFSMHSFRIETYRPWAKRLCNYIKKYAPQAEIVFHQTWSYRADDKGIYNKAFTPGKMYRALAMAYRTIATETGIKRIIPVGDAFHLVAESPEWKFMPDRKFNYKDPVFPKLPKDVHSLHTGYIWEEKDGINLLGFDSHHANIAGEFLGGCVWFEFFFGKDVRKIKFKPEQLSCKDAEFLKAIAHDVASGMPSRITNSFSLGK